MLLASPGISFLFHLLLRINLAGKALMQHLTVETSFVDDVARIYVSDLFT